MSRNIFNDSTETELNQRTINFQNLSVLDATIPILNTGNVVAGQTVGIAGLDLISKDTFDEVKDEILDTRLKNLSNASITTESVATIDENDVVSVAPIRTAGKTIISKETVAEIQTTVLETRLNNLKDASITTESVPTITNNIVSSAPIGTAGKTIISKETVADIQTTVLETRLKNLKDVSIANESVVTIDQNNVVSSTQILQGGKDILNQTSIASIRTLILENVEEAMVIKPTDGNNEINFHTNIPTGIPDGTNLRLQITDATTFVNNTMELDDVKVDNTKKIICNNYAYRDDNTNPIYLTFDNLHAHFTPPNGIRLNQQFQIDSVNGSSAAHIFTTGANKPINYTTRGTGTHVFYTGGDVNGENSTQILNIKPDSIDCNKILKTIVAEGQKIHWDTTSWVSTSAGQVHYYSSNRETLFWGQGVYGMKIKGDEILIQHPLSIASSISTNDTTPMDFYGQKFRFYTPTDVKTLEITPNLVDFWYADFRILGNDKTLTLGSTNGTPHLKLGYDTNVSAKSLIQSVTVPLKIQTNANNSNIELQPHGTGIVNITGDLTVSGDITGDLNGNAQTSTKISSITNSNIVQLNETQTLTNKTLTAPILTSATIGGTLTGNVIGNAETATKIASITNSNIVQLTSSQTLTFKTLVSPIITGNGAIAGIFTGPLTGNADTSTKIASITNSNIVQLTDTQTLTNKTLTAPTITGGTITGGTITGGTIDGTFTGNVLTTSNNVGALGEGHKRFKSLYVEDIIKKNSIYYRVVNLPSTPTLNDYTNVYTLAYFYSLPIFIEGATTTYNLSSLSNMTGGQDWTSIDTKGMILDLNIVAPVTGTFYLKHTSDDGVRVFLGESGTTPLTTLLSLGGVYPYPATWNNQGSTTGYASFSITAGNEYRLRLQYVENSGSASCVFEWNTTSLGSTYSTDWSSIIADNDIGSVNKSISKIYTKTLDFPETLADKVLLYGTSYKLSISNNSLDYITGDTHSFKASTNNLLKLDNTNMTTYKTIIPDTTGAIDIGSSTKLFNNGYINTLKTSSISPETTNGDLTVSGNGSGKVIVNSNLQANLLLTCQIGVVGTTTPYAKFGVKTLGGALSIGNAAWDNNYSIFGHGVDVRNFVNNSFQYGLAVGIGTNSTAQEPYGVIKCIEPGLSWRDLRFSANRLQFDQTGTERMRVAGNIVCSTNIIPDSTINARTIGSSSNLWDEIFCENSTINTSDRTKKKEIDYENIDKYADELLNLKPCSYKFINNTSNRTHMGLISQDLEGTIYEKTGTFIKSPKTKMISETIIVDGMKSSREKQVEIPNEFAYGLRYSELISPLIRLCQKQQEQINQLLLRVDLLESGNVDELSFI